MVLIRQIAVGSLSTLLFTGVAHAVNLEQAKNIIAVQVAQEVHDPELAQDIVNIRFQREILSKLPQQAATDPHAPQAYIASQPTQLAEAQTHDVASHEASTHGHEGMQAMHEEEHEEAEEDAKSDVFYIGMKRIYAPGADASLTGSEIGFEHVLIEHELEVQYGLSKANDPDNSQVGLDVNFKVPFEINESTEFKLGYGTTHSVDKTLDWGNHSVSAEIQHWFNANYGWYVGATRGLTIDKASEVSSGLLINLDRK